MHLDIKTRTAAQTLVDQLVIHGVEHVFCVPGQPAIMHLKIDPEAITPAATLSAIRASALEKAGR